MKRSKKFRSRLSERVEIDTNMYLITYIFDRMPTPGYILLNKNDLTSALTLNVF